RIGPHARGQALLDAVGHRDRLVVVAVGLHGDYRTEDLRLDQLVVLTQPGHDRRLQVEAVAGLHVAPGDDLRVRRRARQQVHHRARGAADISGPTDVPPAAPATP